MSQANLIQEKMLPPPAVQTTRDYFEYSLDFGNIAAGSTVNGNIQIQADSDFMWLLGTYWAAITGALNQTADTQIIPPITVQITDSGSGRQILSQAVPIDAGPFSRSSSLPYPLNPPRVFKARSNIQFVANNLHPANSYRLFLVLHGQKIFTYQP